ncbi:MAG: DNA polymerase-3 subunit chi [Lentisphaeria bacterium]|jgi:DNA polymerase-3 subunit chi
MTQIDFHVMQHAASLDAQRHYACRLAEKAVNLGNRVMIATANDHESQVMNDLLWSFKPESFVPHGLVGDTASNDASVLISHDDDDTHHDVLINLRPGVPEQFSRFKRLIEIVIQEQSSLKGSRKNYAFYQTRGYPIKTHKLKLQD